MKRKSLTTLAAGALVAAVLTGCQSASEVPTVNVVLANHPYTSLLEELIPEFEKESGITVNLTKWLIPIGGVGVGV